MKGDKNMNSKITEQEMLLALYTVVACAERYTQSLEVGGGASHVRPALDKIHALLENQRIVLCKDNEKKLE